jgi:hypothetical protein
MKVTRTPGAGPDNAADSVDEVAGSSESAKASPFAERLNGPPQTSSADDDPANVAGPGPIDPVAEVAAQLASGRITPEEAVALIAEAAVQAALPADASPALRAELRAQLAEIATDDPLLERYRRRLGAWPPTGTSHDP